MGTMADHRCFSNGCSALALDGAGHRHPSDLVRVRLGHAPRSVMGGSTQRR